MSKLWRNIYMCVWWMVSARHWEHDQNFHSQQLWHLHLRYVSVNIKSENLVVIYFDIFVCLVRQIFSTELVFVMPSEFRHQILNLWTLITFLSHLDIKSHEHWKTIRSTLLSVVALSELFFSCRQPAPRLIVTARNATEVFLPHQYLHLVCTYGSFSSGREFWLIYVTF